MVDGGRENPEQKKDGRLVKADGMETKTRQERGRGSFFFCVYELFRRSYNVGAVVLYFGCSLELQSDSTLHGPVMFHDP